MIRAQESAALGRLFLTDEWGPVNRPLGRIVFHVVEVAALKKEAAPAEVWGDVCVVKAVFPGAIVLAYIDGMKRRARYERTWAKMGSFARRKAIVAEPEMQEEEE